MRELAIFYAIGFAQIALFAVLAVAFARMFRAQVETVDIGTPKLLTLRRAHPRISVGAFPAASVGIAGMANLRDDDPDDAWHRLSLGARLVVILGPWAVLAGLAATLIGPARAMHSIGHGIYQLLFVLDLAPLVTRALQLLRDGSLVTTAGVLLAKLVAMNLLPLGAFGGAAVVRELLWRPERGVPRWFERWIWISLLFALVWLGLRPLWAIVTVLRHGY